MTLVILLESAINNCLTCDEVVDDTLIRFLREKSSDCESFEHITEMTSKIEIKHPKNSKISTFTLKFYLFVYNWLINFPVSSISFEVITTTVFLETLIVSRRSGFIHIILTEMAKFLAMFMIATGDYMKIKLSLFVLHTTFSIFICIFDTMF